MLPLINDDKALVNTTGKKKTLNDRNRMYFSREELTLLPLS
jgi:hypothetical protein